ncbi:MAG: aryldialkylphosphatase [Alphaproteobacteria bacterium]|nr:aryldialkylphosphatase [Alphaproteobacteria bacterium]
MTDRAARVGEVQTVLGPVPPAALGVTMIHEHLLIDLTCLFSEPTSERERALARQPVQMSNLSWIRRFWNSNLDNLRLDDEASMVEEARQYRADGGATIVEVSNVGLGRDPIGLQRIARAVSLNIVMGCGYYVAPSHPPDMDDRTVEQIEDEIVRDITLGVGDTGVRAGIIGELGCSWPLTANERKVLQAGARAQRRTGAPISVHIGRHEDSPLEIMACLKDAGADLGRVIMSHMDRIWPPLDKLRTLARAGCAIGLDTFGQETWVYPFGGADRLSDAQRVDLIKLLVADGFDRQIFVSHDVGYKHRLSSYGGSGLSHILTTVIPFVMRRKGLTDDLIHLFLVENPARILAFA